MGRVGAPPAPAVEHWHLQDMGSGWMVRIFIAVIGVVAVCGVGAFVSLGAFPPALVAHDVHKDIPMAAAPAPAPIAAPMGVASALPVAPLAPAH
ncbi:MAG: hypothetical protein ABF590_13150 [Komagataeibacter saccharivorans]